MAVPVERDRTGEPIEAAQHWCRDGWLSAVTADRPVPCPECRPWLTAHPARPPTKAEIERYRLRHPA
jgi:hypothetical protein